MNQRNNHLLKRTRVMTLIMIVGLVLSGLTAIPLVWELDFLVRLFGDGSGWLAEWLLKVNDALHYTAEYNNFLHYGTDWLAFAHIVIAIVFWGAFQDPVWNRWLFKFGMIVCVAIIPWAVVFGEVRGIPLLWRGIDCLFGIIGFVPMWFGWKWTGEVENEPTG